MQTKNQKISIIISVVLFILWIATMATLVQLEFEGSLNSAVFTASVGCVAALALYGLAFLYKHKPIEGFDAQQMKRLDTKIQNVFIQLLYVDIIGFFMMSVAVLMNAYDQKQVRKFGWVGFCVLVTIIAVFVVSIVGYLRVASEKRKIMLQNSNKTLD